MEDILKIFTLKVVDAQMILLSALLFVVFWRLVARTFFNPYFQLLEEREKRTAGALHEADDDLRKAVDLETIYAERIESARVSGMKSKLQILESAKAEAAKVLEVAQHEADKVKSRGKEALRDTTENLLKAFPEEVDRLSFEIIKQVTSDTISLT